MQLSCRLGWEGAGPGRRVAEVADRLSQRGPRGSGARKGLGVGAKRSSLSPPTHHPSLGRPPPDSPRPRALQPRTQLLMSTNPFARGGSLTAQLSSHLLPTANSAAQHTPASASPTQSQPAASTSTPIRAAPGTPHKGKSPSTRSSLGNEVATPPRVGSSSPFGSPSSSPTAGQSPAQSPSQAKENVQSSPGSGVSGSPQSSNGGGNSNRRVKLYKLLDEHWEDLGTGICSTIFTTNSTSPSNSPDKKQQPGSLNSPKSSGSGAEDGAWIIVKREAEQPPQDQDPDAPPPPPPKGPPGEVILNTKVFPYPTGYDSSEEDEDESGYDKQGRPLDPGGYQRQQDTLIVWTEKGTEQEMALSFATSSGCAEIWDFIRNARKWAGECLLGSECMLGRALLA